MGANNEGFCEGVSKKGIGPFGSIWEVHSIISFISFAALLWWARQQYLKATSSKGFYVPDQPVIFPVYLKLLVANAITSLTQVRFARARVRAFQQ